MLLLNLINPRGASTQKFPKPMWGEEVVYNVSPRIVACLSFLDKDDLEKGRKGRNDVYCVV